MVASYLVHHSYCATAEAFAKSTDQAVHEELASIKNRQSESLQAAQIGSSDSYLGPILGLSDCWSQREIKLAVCGSMIELNESEWFISARQHAFRVEHSQLNAE